MDGTEQGAGVSCKPMTSSIIRHVVSRREAFWCDWQMYFGSYMDMKVRITNNDLFIFIHNLLTSDWPQGEVFPKSLDEFLDRLYEPIYNLVKSVSCQGRVILK